MGVDRHEPVFRQGFENSLEYNATKSLFQEFSWVGILGKFEGFNDQVCLAFARGLKDRRVQVGDLVMEVLEKSITRAMRLSTEGERCSKNNTITREEWKKLLKLQFQNVKLTTTVPGIYIKEDWQKVLMVLHKFITGKGRYPFTY